MTTTVPRRKAAIVILNASSVGTITGAPPLLDLDRSGLYVRLPSRTRRCAPTRSPPHPACRRSRAPALRFRPATRVLRPRLLHRPRDHAVRERVPRLAPTRAFRRAVRRRQPHREGSTRSRRCRLARTLATDQTSFPAPV